MRNSTNKILIVAVVLLLAANLVMVYMMVKNKGRRGHRREMKGGGPNEMIKALDLSDDQKKAYDQLKDEHFRASRPLFDSIRAAKIAYFNLVKDSTVTDSTFEVYSENVRQKQALADKMVFEHFRKIRQLFTPEQRIKFDSLVQNNMQRERGSGGKRKKD